MIVIYSVRPNKDSSYILFSIAWRENPSFVVWRAPTSLPSTRGGTIVSIYSMRDYDIHKKIYSLERNVENTWFFSFFIYIQQQVYIIASIRKSDPSKMGMILFLSFFCISSEECLSNCFWCSIMRGTYFPFSYNKRSIPLRYFFLLISLCYDSIFYSWISQMSRCTLSESHIVTNFFSERKKRSLSGFFLYALYLLILI